MNQLMAAYIHGKEKQGTGLVPKPKGQGPPSGELGGGGEAGRTQSIIQGGDLGGLANQGGKKRAGIASSVSESISGT